MLTSKMTYRQRKDYYATQINLWSFIARRAQRTVDRRKNKKPTKKLLDALDQAKRWQELLELHEEEQLRKDLEWEDAIAKSS